MRGWPEGRSKISPMDHRQPWQPSPLIRGSVALHVAAIGVTLARPQWWPWTLSAVVANHLLLAASGLWPRSRLLGPNWTQLPGKALRAVAITIDDGPDPEVTARVLDLLAEHDARATFFCIGERVDRHPGLALAIAARGHEIGNHSYRHLKRFSLLGPRGVAEEIARAQDAIGAATGQVAHFFRAPAGLRNPFLEPALARANRSSCRSLSAPHWRAPARRRPPPRPAVRPRETRQIACATHRRRKRLLP